MGARRRSRHVPEVVYLWLIACAHHKIRHPETALGDPDQGVRDYIEPRLLERVSSSAATCGAHEFLEKERSRTVSIAEVAAFVGMEKCSFSRHFSKRVGIRFVDYSRLYKVAQTIDILVSSKRNLCEVGTLVGVVDSSTMWRIFNFVTGSGPRTFARRVDVMRKTSADCAF